MMKKVFGYLIVLTGIVSTLSVTSCREEYITYSDREYVMFADTMKIYAVQKDASEVLVPLVSTVATDYDRTFAVRVIDVEGQAIDRFHYSLESNTATIKSGELGTSVKILADYENLDPENPVYVSLELVAPDAVKSDLFADRTKVVLQRVDPFVLEDFIGEKEIDGRIYGGWCVFSSMFLYQYSLTGDYQRLVYCERKPLKKNPQTKEDLSDDTIICHNWLIDGKDIEMVFHPDDPLNQYITVPEGQTASDEGSFFGITYGDDRILVKSSSLYTSNFMTWGRYLYAWVELYVETLGEPYGSVGHFYNIMEFVSDAEARRLFDEGMQGYFDYKKL